MSEILIQGGHVFIDSQLVRADVRIEGNTIVAVGDLGSVGMREEDVIQARDHILIPGLINAHTHSHNNLSRGSAENWTLEELLVNAPALQSGRTVEDHYLSAAVGAIEMIRTGCTTAFDAFSMFPGPSMEAVEAVVQAYVDVGLRVELAPALTDLRFVETIPGIDALLPGDLRSDLMGIPMLQARELIDLAELAIKRWDGAAGGRIRIGVAPSIATQCSDELLIACSSLAKTYDSVVQTHVSETKVQAIEAHRRWGCTTVDRLEQVGLLGPKLVGGHGVWLTELDITTLDRNESTISHNPASNLRLGSGIAPVRELLDHGVNVAIGTDGAISSDNQNMFEAMRLAGMIGNIRFPYDPSNWVSAQDVWQMATLNGAKAAGLAGRLGRIAPGYLADITILDRHSPFLEPTTSPLAAFVYSETGQSVKTVIIDGRVVLNQGELATVDELDLRKRAQKASDRVHEAGKKHLVNSVQLLPYVYKACSEGLKRPMGMGNPSKASWNHHEPEFNLISRNGETK